MKVGTDAVEFNRHEIGAGTAKLAVSLNSIIAVLTNAPEITLIVSNEP